jgi:hypothetical protein
MLVPPPAPAVDWQVLSETAQTVAADLDGCAFTAEVYAFDKQLDDFGLLSWARAIQGVAVGCSALFDPL